MGHHVSADYNGSVVVFDIDDTLRDGRLWGRSGAAGTDALARAQPIPGAAALARMHIRKSVDGPGSNCSDLTCCFVDTRSVNTGRW
jgi:hypothetical protein